MPLDPNLAKAPDFKPAGNWGPVPQEAPPVSSGWGSGTGKTLAQRLADKEAAYKAARQATEAQRAAQQAAAVQQAADAKQAADSERAAAILAAQVQAHAQQSDAPSKRLEGQEEMQAAKSSNSAKSSNLSGGHKDWGLKIEMPESEGQKEDLSQEEEEERKTRRRNLRGFPEGPLSCGRARPAALLRQGSTVDLEAFVIEVDWKQYPSVVTWTLHKPVQQPELEGFAAFAAALDSDDDLEPAVVPSEPRAGKENAEDSIIGHVPSLDDFELLRLVGAGGFGKVYQVRKKSSGRIMALKAMRKHLVIEELNVEGTHTERSVLEQIQHPFVVRLHCAFHDTGRLYLLMDWHNGGHLLRLLQEKSPFTENEMRFYVSELVLAIEGLHAHGIVHRDLKPENVLIDCHGHLVVTDFGASKIAIENECEDDGDIRTNSWVGTEMYMAPEQLLGQVYGRVVDWWAVGVLAFEMLSGDNPFYHENPEQVALKVQKKKLVYSKHISGPCVSLLKGLLTRDPSRRLGYGGASEVKNHPFFLHKGFKWQDVFNRSVSPPFELGTAGDMESVARVHERYTDVTPVLSPLESTLLSPKSQALFKGFEWVSPYYSPAITPASRPTASPRALNLDDSPYARKRTSNPSSPKSRSSGSPGSPRSPGAAVLAFRSPGCSPSLAPVHEHSTSLQPLLLPRQSALDQASSMAIISSSATDSHHQSHPRAIAIPGRNRP